MTTFPPPDRSSPGSESAAAAAARHGVGQLRDDLHSVRDDLTRLKDDAVNTASHAAYAAREEAMRRVDVASDHVADMYDSMCAYVRERPATSLLIALGAGAILSRLMGSSRR